MENLTKRKKNECKLILEKYFGRSYGDYNCDINSERVSVKYKDMRYSIVDLYFYTSWKGDSMSYDKIELSMPSFRPDNVEAWVVDRFQMLTSITSIVVTNEEYIINDLNSVLIKYDKLRETFRTDMKYLRDSIKEQESDISILKKESMIENKSEKKLTREDIMRDDKLLDSIMVSLFSLFITLYVSYNWYFNFTEGFSKRIQFYEKFLLI